MNTKTYYKVYFICWLPDNFGSITTELDHRTERIRYFDTKEDAVEYIKEAKEGQKEWLAKIELKKVIETDEQI